MISIAKVNNAKYHLEHSQFDYYSEQENEKGEFRGALMKWQKLEGKEVNEKAYMKQIDHGGEDNKGVDLCFSPPKDWTLLYNLVDDETKLKMEEIRDKAVNSIVKGIEQNTYYRETKDGETTFKLAKGVGMATFNHHTSREVQDDKINPGGYVDPQEHTHITVFPKVLGQDGKFHSHTLLDLKYEKRNNHEGLRYLDQLGQYELCKGLQELGFNIYEADKHGNFSIEGITDELRQEFSKRKEQINNVAGEGATYNEKKEVALKFRAGKDSHDLASLKEIWKEKMEDLGFNQENIKSLKTGKIKHEDKKLEDIIDKDKPLSNKKIKTLALSESKFTDKSFKDKLNEFQGNKKIRPISKNNNLYANNKAKEKLCDRVDSKRKQSDKKSDKEKLSDKKKEKEEKNIKKNEQKKDKQQQPDEMPKQAPLKDSVSSSLFDSEDKPKNKSNIVAPVQMTPAGSKQELVSSIDEMELQMFSMKPDGTVETEIKRGELMERIGELKKQLMETEKQEIQNLAAQLENQSSEQSTELGDGIKIKEPETEEEELLEKSASQIFSIGKKEDSMKEVSATSQFEKTMNNFLEAHGLIVENAIEQMTQQPETTTEIGAEA